MMAVPDLNPVHHALTCPFVAKPWDFSSCDCGLIPPQLLPALEDAARSIRVVLGVGRAVECRDGD